MELKEIENVIHCFIFILIMVVFCCAIMIGTFSILFCNIKTENEVKETVVHEIEEVEVVRYPTEYELKQHDTEVIEAIAKTVWGEARDCSTTEQAAVIWCILNRKDDERFPNDILEVITQENQFDGYNVNNPVDEEIWSLCEDVFFRWVLERISVGNVGRVLPKEYCWFRGNGQENIFRDAYDGNYNIWNWALDSPYED